MSHKLHEEIKQQAPIEPRKAEEGEKSKRVVIQKVKATFEGTSKPQAGSVRNQVLQFIQNAPEATATVAELEAHFQQPVRGYLQKLVEKNHLIILEES